MPLNSSTGLAAMLVPVLIASASLSGCNSTNDPVAGRVSVDMGGHQVVVTDCHVQKVPDVRTSADGNSLQFSICDQTVVIQGSTLFVNGDAYGQLGSGDRVLVSNGKATIQPH